MARLHRRRQKERNGTWREALLFNSLLLILIVLAVRILISAYTAESTSEVPDIQARNETRRAIDEAFQMIVPKGDVTRAFWADQISRELESRDFSAARGYLLAAPVMLERDDARAIQAAADAEESGSEDERLTRAALLFLPNEVRASYQRAIEPPRVALTTREGEADSGETTGETGAAPEEAQTDASGSEPDAETLPDATDTLSAPARLPAFSLIGDRTDLVRRSQRWVNGDPVNGLQLRLSAIGLIPKPETADKDIYPSAISILKAAGRANRLSPAYADYLHGRVDLALPEDEAFQAVREALSSVAPMSQLEERVIAAYESTLDPAGLARLERDLRAIDRIAGLTSPSGAVTLLETARSPEDVRKLQLIAEAGGDRAVALTKQIGPRVLRLAQIGVKWSMELAAQLMALAAIGMALVWTALSAVSNARPVRHYRH